jgi:hypothetical protein
MVTAYSERRSISSHNPGLGYLPTFFLFIATVVAFQANNQLIKVTASAR